MIVLNDIYVCITNLVINHIAIPEWRQAKQQQQVLITYDKQEFVFDILQGHSIYQTMAPEYFNIHGNKGQMKLLNKHLLIKISNNNLRKYGQPIKNIRSILGKMTIFCGMYHRQTHK